MPPRSPAATTTPTGSSPPTARTPAAVSSKRRGWAPSGSARWSAAPHRTRCCPTTRKTPATAGSRSCC
jgi:hypothetical protein